MYNCSNIHYQYVIAVASNGYADLTGKCSAKIRNHIYIAIVSKARNKSVTNLDVN
jgi:hypothetical protein